MFAFQTTSLKHIGVFVAVDSALDTLVNVVVEKIDHHHERVRAEERFGHQFQVPVWKRYSVVENYRVQVVLPH